MAYVPSDGRTSGQEDEKESTDQFYQSTGPEVKAFHLGHQQHLHIVFSQLRSLRLSWACHLVLWFNIPAKSLQLLFTPKTLRLCVLRVHLSW